MAIVVGAYLAQTIFDEVHAMYVARCEHGTPIVYSASSISAMPDYEMQRTLLH